MATIIIAEDDIDQREMLSEFLRDEGHRVDVAVNGVEAARMIQSNGYDVAICDVHLPLKDGLTVLKESRQKGTIVPIIMLSAFMPKEDERWYLDLGARAALPKPFDFGELLELIVSVTRQVH
jgi:two-component system response regulator VanR